MDYNITTTANQFISRALFGDFNNLDGVDEVPIDYTICIFPGTTNVYSDCCTGSSYKTCNYLAVMFWASFVGYASVFGYIITKNPWVKT